MLGKITERQEKIILKLFSSLPKNNEYEIVHLGAGRPIPRYPGDRLDFRAWSRQIHLVQCENFPHPRGSFRTLVRKLNVRYSDLYSNASDEEFQQWSTGVGLRSEEALLNPDFETLQLTGKQEFCRLDAMDIDLPDESLDYLVAVGLYSKYVSLWNNLDQSLSEAKRVLRKSGALILTLHSNYLEEFSEAATLQAFDIEILDDSPDETPESGRDGSRMLLSLKPPNPSAA